MNNPSSRQRVLYLAARLYELAAEFTGDELSEMLKQHLVGLDAAAVRQVVEALIKLHNVADFGDVPTSREATTDSTAHQITRAYSGPSKEASSLEEMFHDRAAFPAVTDVADVLRIPARKKESRSRYIARVINFVDSLDRERKDYFFAELAKRLNKQPNSFLTKWSKLIEEL